MLHKVLSPLRLCSNHDSAACLWHIMITCDDLGAAALLVVLLVAYHILGVLVYLSLGRGTVVPLMIREPVNIN